MATPRRSLRARTGTPLPAVATKASNAYGAQGKAFLHTQVTTTATEFDNAFESARQTVPAPKPRRSSRNASTVTSNRPDEESEAKESDDIILTGPAIATQYHEESDFSDERPGTAIQTSAIYGGEMPPPPRPLLRPRTQAPEPKRNDGNDYEPGRLQLFFRTLPRYLPRLLQDAHTDPSSTLITSLARVAALLGMVALIYSLYSYTALPYHLTAGRDSLVRGTNSFLHHRIWSGEPQYGNTTAEQHQMNINLFSRIQKLESRLAELGAQVGLHHETLSTLQDILPSSIVVRKVEGKWAIESHFWDALADRLSQGEPASLWQAFARANEEKLATLNASITHETLDQAIRDGRVLSAESFSHLIDQNFQWLQSQYQSDFKELQASQLDLVRSIADQTAQDVFNRSPLSSYAKSQLETLVKANQIHSAYEALRTPNYFSVGMGARTEHRLTSPTMRNPPTNIIQWLWTNLSPIQYDKNPAPIAALERWDEATDCWCASPSKGEKGRAQVTVTMPVEIYPQMLVVEHIPAQGALDIKAAPKELEVWAEMESPARAQQMTADISRDGPFYSQCGQPPTPNFVCIGKAKYEIHSHKYIQTFSLWPDSRALGLLTRRISVRVTENWGNGNYTCIYRLRMTGTRPADSHPIVPETH